MQVVYSSCCGLDIHKKFVVACFMNTGADGNVQYEIRTFTTMTQELLALVDWLQAVGCTHVAMESTSFFWRPVYNLLEGLFEVLVGNAYHMKTVPGRKTQERTNRSLGVYPLFSLCIKIETGAIFSVIVA
jgi:transposase